MHYVPRLSEARGAAIRALADAEIRGWSTPEEPPEWTFGYLTDACPNPRSEEIEAFEVAWALGCGKDSVTQKVPSGRWALEASFGEGRFVRGTSGSRQAAADALDRITKTGVHKRRNVVLRIVRVDQ